MNTEQITEQMAGPLEQKSCIVTTVAPDFLPYFFLQMSDISILEQFIFTYKSFDHTLVQPNSRMK